MSRLYLYLHTHWDREWYLPFETFRMRLLDTVRQIVDCLEKGLLPSFFLDGQSVLFEDVLEIEPELAPRLSKLMEAGKLSAGPWYVLADQMLVSGESLIRNLKLGLAVARRFGQPAAIGYCPDTFGHSQDLPRILAGFGIGTAIVWRGVPALSGGPLFWWQSPDGSKVLTYHLGRSYYQSAFHEQIAAVDLAKRLSTWLDSEDSGQVSTLCRQIDAALYPVGGDHFGPPAGLSEKLEQLEDEFKKRADGNIEVIPVQLPDFMGMVERAASGKVEQVIAGELRDNHAARRHANAYLLHGVLSSRLYLKQDNRASERRLAGIAEPLHTLLHITGVLPYPLRQLEYAWRLLLKNQPHDSICGCGVDEIHDQMRTRTRLIDQALDALETDASFAIAQTDGFGKRPANKAHPAAIEPVSPRDPAFGANRLIAFNLSGTARSGLVKFKWASDPEQAMPADSPNLQMISRSWREELFGGQGLVPYYKNVELDEAWIWADQVPAFGWKELPWPPAQAPDGGSPAIEVSAGRLANGILNLTVDRQGHVQVEILSGQGAGRKYRLGHRIQDAGDGGDTYNFDPIAGAEPISASFKALEIGQKGPLVGSILITYEIDIPRRADRSGNQVPPLLVRCPETERHLITTEISLRRGSPIVHFETVWENKSADHRLEALLDTGGKVTRTFSENHFSLVERPHLDEPAVLPVEPACEAAPDRFPCQRFFMANDQVFLNQGLPEYGVCGSQVSITLMRAVSILSRGRMRTRGGGAGPHLPTPGANCLGMNRAYYGWAPLLESNRGDPEALYALAEMFSDCFWAAAGRGRSELSAGSLLELESGAVRSCALYTGDDGQSVLLRLLNTSNREQEVQVKTGFKFEAVHACGLDEQPRLQLPFKGATGGAALKLKLAANELLTLRFLAATLALMVLLAMPIASSARAPWPDSPLAPEAQVKLEKAGRCMKSGQPQKAAPMIVSVLDSANDIPKCLAIASFTETYGYPLISLRRQCLQKALSLCLTRDDYILIALKSRHFEFYEITGQCIDHLIQQAETVPELLDLARKAQAVALNDVAHRAMEKAGSQAKDVPESIQFAHQSQQIGMDDLCRRTIKDLIDGEERAQQLCAILKDVEGLGMEDLNRYCLKKALDKAQTTDDLMCVYEGARRNRQNDIMQVALFRGRKLTLIQKIQSEQSGQDADLERQQAEAEKRLQEQHAGGSKSGF